MKPSIILPMSTEFCHSASYEIALQAGQIWSAILPVGARVHCVRGVIWLTQSEDFTDTIVRAGQSHIVLQRSHVVAQVIEAQDAVLTVHRT